MTSVDQTIKNFVEALYQSELARKSDPEGLNYWSEAIASGRLSQAEVANAIAKSPEGQITQAYRTHLGRDPEMEGRIYWTTQVDTDVLTVDQAVNAIAKSPEAQAFAG